MTTSTSIGQSPRDKETGEPDDATSIKSGSAGGWGKRPVLDLARSLPSYHVLAGTVEVFIGNAHEMRSRPGKKTDKRDAAWIAELLAHGLIRPSFVPPPDICALRDVTRTRVAMVQTRSQSKNRVHKLLEDTNLKLGSVVSDLFGVTGRRMLAALVAGERDPQV
jgi:transposase